MYLSTYLHLLHNCTWLHHLSSCGPLEITAIFLKELRCYISSSAFSSSTKRDMKNDLTAFLSGGSALMLCRAKPAEVLRVLLKSNDLFEDPHHTERPLPNPRIREAVSFPSRQFITSEILACEICLRRKVTRWETPSFISRNS